MEFFLHSLICLGGAHMDSLYCPRRPHTRYSWCIQSQNVTKNTAVSNNAPQLEGAVTNLPHAAKAVTKATTWLWFSGNSPEWDLGQQRVASPRNFSRFTYILRTAHTNSQTFRGYFCFGRGLTVSGAGHCRAVAAKNLLCRSPRSSIYRI